MRKYLIAGLLVWVPLGVTVLVVKLVVDLMDRLQVLLPPTWRPEALLGFSLPGLGVVVALVVVLGTGIVVANLLGRRLVSVGEYLVDQIPLVRTVYTVAKQVMETLTSSQGDAFRRVLLIEYPRRGIWTLAFQTGSGFDEIDGLTGHEMLSVFVPTTPNPTSGFVLFVRCDEVQELDMSVDEAMRLVISVGVAAPDRPRKDKQPNGGGEPRVADGDGAS